MAMKALMLAAGVGRRLYGDDYNQPPKALLEFGGKTLLRRHIEQLVALGVDELVLVVGHRKDEVLAAAHGAAPEDYVTSLVQSPLPGRRSFRCGRRRNICAARRHPFHGCRRALPPAGARTPGPIAAPQRFLLDRAIEPGEEPVKLCIRDGVPVDFGKRVEGVFDLVGEWPGFMRMGPAMAGKVADATDAFIEAGRLEVTYEEAMGAVVRAEPPGTFGYEDISGLPWIEIDFPATCCGRKRSSCHVWRDLQRSNRGRRSGGVKTRHLDPPTLGTRIPFPGSRSMSGG